MDNFTGDFFKLIGKPMIWRTTVYGEVAVHVQKISPNGRVAVLTIDGGEASTPAQRFPELSDGIGFAILGDLSKRPARRPLKRAGQPSNAIRDLAEEAGLVKPIKRASRVRSSDAARIKGEVTF
jgi:hypothetical protein